MRLYTLRLATFVLGLACLLNCAPSQNSNTDTNQDEASTIQTVTTTETEVTFQASLTILPENTAEFGESLHMDLSHEYTLPLHFNSSGELSFYAFEFPKIVYRICHINSSAENCDYYLDRPEAVDMDLVFDSCDRLVKEHAECGENDQTQYAGVLTPNGELSFENIAIRARLFFVTSHLDGYTSKPSQTGSIDDLSRISLDLTTETVFVEGKTESGDNVSNTGTVKLIGTGTIPERTIGDLPSLGVSSFIAEIDGEFSQNPFEILAE